MKAFLKYNLHYHNKILFLIIKKNYMSQVVFDYRKQIYLLLE